MNRSEVIYLISSRYEKDEYGVNRAIIEKKKCYCDVTSVTATEFFQGGAQGLKPDLRFVVQFCDYSNQMEVEYNNTLYSIYRTYRGKNDLIELYAERKQGVTNGENG